MGASLRYGAWACVIFLLSACGNYSGSDHIINGKIQDGIFAYTPVGLRDAYHVTPDLGDGSGQTVAIIDFYGNPNVQKDLDAFSTKFLLPPITLQIAYPGGTVTWDDATCHFDTADGEFANICAGWAMETSLDVQMVHSIAPGANILLVVPSGSADSPDMTAVMNAIDYAVAQGATVVSMSFGMLEAGFASKADMTQYDSHFQASGVTFIASSGDDAGSLQWPSLSSYVLSVGGTHLEYDILNGSRSESGWSATGGGVSKLLPIPSYQVGIGGTASTTMRSVPDVSLIADLATGVWIRDSINAPADNGESVQWVNGMPTPAQNDLDNYTYVGGTSAAAPLWAGLIALVNANRPKGSPIGDVHAALYSPNASSVFTDITSGCWDSTAPTPGCAGTGYDLLTGLGTPIADKLIPYLVQWSH